MVEEYIWEVLLVFNLYKICLFSMKALLCKHLCSHCVLGSLS